MKIFFYISFLTYYLQRSASGIPSINDKRDFFIPFQSPEYLRSFHTLKRKRVQLFWIATSACILITYFITHKIKKDIQAGHIFSSDFPMISKLLSMMNTNRGSTYTVCSHIQNIAIPLLFSCSTIFALKQCNHHRLQIDHRSHYFNYIPEEPVSDFYKNLNSKYQKKYPHHKEVNSNLQLNSNFILINWLPDRIRNFIEANFNLRAFFSWHQHKEHYRQLTEQYQFITEEIFKDDIPDTLTINIEEFPALLANVLKNLSEPNNKDIQKILLCENDKLYKAEKINFLSFKIKSFIGIAILTYCFYLIIKLSDEITSSGIDSLTIMDTVRNSYFLSDYYGLLASNVDKIFVFFYFIKFLVIPLSIAIIIANLLHTEETIDFMHLTIRHLILHHANYNQPGGPEFNKHKQQIIEGFNKHKDKFTLPKFFAFIKNPTR